MPRLSYVVKKKLASKKALCYHVCMSSVRKSIRVKGIVQGVGFRPFVFRLAQEHGVKGCVLNDTEGVLIEAEGRAEDVAAFTEELTSKAPSLAYVLSVTSAEVLFRGDKSFTIEKSKAGDERTAFYSPDVAVCDDCLREFRDSENRRYMYPFITCINCGPRFSIIKDIPYDRSRTSMDMFPLCDACAAEYSAPQDRRFHAQPVACPICGPRLEMRSCPSGEFISADAQFIAKETMRLIFDDKIIAIKGMGGYLLACDARSDAAVEKLRKRKRRPFKAFACMVGGLSQAKGIAHISDEEAALLTSKERPIVLLDMKADAKFPPSKQVAPSLSRIGIMLPYMPFQHLLFDISPDALLLMTSGNIAEEPIIYNDGQAAEGFKDIADYIVTYNRDIIEQNDDSVMFIDEGTPRFVRRSRGFVPRPLRTTKTDGCILAVGGDIKSSFAISKSDFTIVSQYIGDMIHPKTQQAFKHSLEHYMHIFDAVPDVIVCDMHPGYITTNLCAELSDKFAVPLIKVQHHHAHIAAILEEHHTDLEEQVLGIAFDGTGYGLDGVLWGGEFLLASKGEFKRIGRFGEFLLPGGESAIKNVWRIGAALLHNAFGLELPMWADKPDLPQLIEIMEKRINSPVTSSIGRLFDGVSALLGFCESVSSEAEAAQLLEEAALRSKGAKPIVLQAKDDGLIPTGELVRHIVSLIKKGEHPNDIAAAFHMSVAHSSAALAVQVKELYGVRKAALGGGCFHNRLLLNTLRGLLQNVGFQVLLPKELPFNDGCISFGQTAVAKALLLKGAV